MNKAFFMPYDPNHPGFPCAQYEYGSLGGAEMDKLQKDIDFETDKGNNAVAVWYKPKTKAPFLQSLNTGQIYIRGHGMPGFKSIEGGRGGERIDFDVVADRLIASGLPKAFSGKIKLFNCHSAESGAPGSDPECVGPPFARQVADELYSRGYKHCTFFGYVGSIDSFAKDGSDGKHHYIRKTVLGKQTEVARASDGRIQFRPTVKMRTPNIFQRLFG
jgi:hypothetical protein